MYEGARAARTSASNAVAARAWALGSRISREACIRDAILGRHCHIGRNVSVNSGAVLGDKTTLTDYTKA